MALRAFEAAPRGVKAMTMGPTRDAYCHRQMTRSDPPISANAMTAIPNRLMEF